MLAPEHPIFSERLQNQLRHLFPTARTTEPGLKFPLIQTVMKDGIPVVIWSHFSLSNGWEQLPNPYAKAYSDPDALKLGTNILVYACAH